jgi:DNA-binding NarL/FixJ family response regulator
MVGERETLRGPSDRERIIIQRVAEGCKNREIADSLGTTEHVIKNYLRTIYDKLGLWNRVELALWYVARQNEQVYQA